MTSHLRFLLQASLCLLLMHSAGVSARWQDQLPAAQLLGSGDFRFFGLRVYKAELWAATLPLNKTTPFALQLRYHRTISRERLVQASLDEMTRLAASAPTTSVQSGWRQALQRSFEDVQPGDAITGVFLPDQGVQFYVGARASHNVIDPLFAQAFFAIWLDPQTRAPKLREQLLGLTVP